MGKIWVKDSLRKKRRAIKDALGDDILRYLAELITNADDSYRRLESKKILTNEEKVIYIELKKEKRKSAEGDENYIISVTDNAEGMTEEEMLKIFGTYGEDNSGGIEVHARGIFGQGASDVLRAGARESRTACIESIKNGEISKILYSMDEELNAAIDSQKIELSESKTNEYRNNLRIPNNGTRISFGIPSTVKFNNKIKENLPELISKYPSFRYLLNQENRKVIYIDQGEMTEINSKKYQFDEENLLSDESFEFDFEGKQINCKLKMYLNENKREDGTNIIVRDENYSVFDNTMFDFQNYPSAQTISGELLIEGLYNLCYEHLNAEEPDAIVRDNRTGFDPKNQFYIKLNKEIGPQIQKILNENGDNNNTTNLGNNKKFNQALKKLNKYLKTELKDEINGGNDKEIKPPIEGIKFARMSATITKGKQYDLKLYINSNIISEAENIEIICEENNYIQVSPKVVNYSIDEVEDALVTKSISIKALECTNESIIVLAKTKSRVAAIAIDVIDIDIHYPENGLEFYPNEVSLVYDKPHVLKLYVDTTIIPIGSEIEINPNELDIEENKIKIEDKCLINDEIAVMEVVLNGGNLGETYNVEAKYEEISASAKITLIEATKNGNSGGLIAGIKLQPNESMGYQSYYNPRDHIIYINTYNPINLRIMGEMRDKDPENPTFNREQSKYLCDIIATQAATILVKQKNIKNGEINSDDLEEAVELVQNLIQDHKNKIYQELYSAILSTAE